MSEIPNRKQADPLDQLMASHGDGVLRYLRSLVRDPEVARVLLQDTFLKLIDRVEGAGRTLVYATARNCALDHLRRLKVRRGNGSIPAEASSQLSAPALGSRPDVHLDAAGLRDAILGGLATLPEDQRTAFHLSEIEGIPYAEIADLLGVSPGTIASRKHHAVRKLRQHLRRLGYEH